MLKKLHFFSHCPLPARAKPFREETALTGPGSTEHTMSLPLLNLLADHNHTAPTQVWRSCSKKSPGFFLGKTSTTLKLSCQEGTAYQPTRLSSEGKKASKCWKFPHISPTRYICNFSTCGTTEENGEVILHRPHVSYQAKVRIHFSNLWSCHPAVLSPAQGAVPPLQKKKPCSLLKMPQDTPAPGRRICDPTSFPSISLLLLLCLPAGQEMLPHFEALCLAPRTWQQWEVLKMLLLKLFSVLPLKRDEGSLINCRIYETILPYLLSKNTLSWTLKHCSAT